MSNLTERPSGRLVAARLEIRDDLIRTYEIEQENYILLEFAEPEERNYGIRIWMDAGVGETELTTAGRMNEILCQAGNGWTAVKEIFAAGAVSWRLSRSEEAEGSCTRIYALFQSVIVYRAGTAQIHFCYCSDDVDGPHSGAEVRKTEQKLRIEGFYPQPGTFDAPDQEVLLTWCVLGADSCLLNPGNQKVEPVGSRLVTGLMGRHWTLTAVRGKESAERSIRLFAYQDVVTEYVHIRPEKYLFGGTDELRWNVDADKLVIEWGKEQKEMPVNGLMTVKNSCSEYVFHRWKDGLELENVYARNPDPKYPVILFDVEAREETVDGGTVETSYLVTWKVGKCERTALNLFYKKEKSAQYTLLVRNVKRTGEEIWKVQREEGCPVTFILNIGIKKEKEQEIYIRFSGERGEKRGKMSRSYGLPEHRYE